VHLKNWTLKFEWWVLLKAATFEGGLQRVNGPNFHPYSLTGAARRPFADVVHPWNGVLDSKFGLPHQRATRTDRRVPAFSLHSLSSWLPPPHNFFDFGVSDIANDPQYIFYSSRTGCGEIFTISFARNLLVLSMKFWKMSCSAVPRSYSKKCRPSVAPFVDVRRLSSYGIHCSTREHCRSTCRLLLWRKGPARPPLNPPAGGHERPKMSVNCNLPTLLRQVYDPQLLVIGPIPWGHSGPVTRRRCRNRCAGGVQQ